jgi:hypothetical protein
MTTPPRWLPDEAAYLERLSGEVPWPTLVRRMKIAATANSWPRRSEKAIAMRLRRTGQPGRARCGEWTTTGGVGEILGCPGTRIDAWLRRKRIREILEPHHVGQVRYINRRSWRRLAREMPRVFGGFSADVLFLLLEDRELAESVAEAHPRPMGDWRVRCLETGQVFSSCGAAAKEYHVSQAAVSLAIRQARPIGVLGLRFEALRRTGPLTQLSEQAAA